MTLDEAIGWWEKCDSQYGFEERRYHACIGALNGVVAIADETDNGSDLEMYTEQEFIAWIAEAKRIYDEWMQDDSDEWEDVTELDALFEATKPEGIRRSH